MVEEKKYCVDIMNQITGIQSALEQVSLLLMQNHLVHCVSEAIIEGQGEEKISEIMDVIRHYTKVSRLNTHGKDHRNSYGYSRVSW